MFVVIKGWAPGTRAFMCNIGEGATDLFQSQTTRITAKESISKTTLDVTFTILSSIKILYFHFPQHWKIQIQWILNLVIKNGSSLRLYYIIFFSNPPLH